jgi:hypothetical protein
MINATLCSTNRDEPWAANVDFEVDGAVWVVGLSAKYAHYKNILQNSNIVVVYKTSDFEILAKGTTSLSEPDEDQIATATITLTWLRLVENGATVDHTDANKIEEIVRSHT